MMLSLVRRTTGRSLVSRLQLARGYHENIVDHYENPRNVGSFDKNDEMVGTVSAANRSARRTSCLVICGVRRMPDSFVAHLDTCVSSSILTLSFFNASFIVRVSSAPRLAVM
jgi:NifU-like N terminal domain